MSIRLWVVRLSLGTGTRAYHSRMPRSQLFGPSGVRVAGHSSPRGVNDVSGDGSPWKHDEGLCGLL